MKEFSIFHHAEGLSQLQGRHRDWHFELPVWPQPRLGSDKAALLPVVLLPAAGFSASAAKLPRHGSEAPSPRQRGSLATAARLPRHGSVRGVSPPPPHSALQCRHCCCRRRLTSAFVNVTCLCYHCRYCCARTVCPPPLHFMSPPPSVAAWHGDILTSSCQCLQLQQRGRGYCRRL